MLNICRPFGTLLFIKYFLLLIFRPFGTIYFKFEIVNLKFSVMISFQNKIGNKDDNVKGSQKSFLLLPIIIRENNELIKY